jgi:hypothetical protein
MVIFDFFIRKLPKIQENIVLLLMLVDQVKADEVGGLVLGWGQGG